MTRTLSVVVVLVGIWSVAVGAQTPAIDPVDGTWRINLARSTYSPGPPPPQMGTQVRRFATLDGGWHLFELTSVTPEGDPVFQFTTYTNGVPGLAIVRAVSKDGKTYTETFKGKDSVGREVHNVVVFDRVR